VPLTVLSVGFSFAAAGPGSVGGAEQVLGILDKALDDAGHTSVVVAGAGSQTRGRLFAPAHPSPELLDETARFRYRVQFQSAIDSALSACEPDVIHLHGLDFCEYAFPAGIPAVVTLHLPVSWYSAGIWGPRWRHAQFCCVSESQRRCCPSDRPIALVENGVEIPPSWTKEKGNFAVTLGRVCPEKNAHAALQAGTLAGIPVLMAGKVFPYPEHLAYFCRQIAPMLGAQSRVAHRFLGALSPVRLRALLGRAKCLLHPTLAPETSSLAAMEALAVGTPVIAYPSGALPEIVEDGVTGFLVKNVEEMAEAIGKLHTLSPAACRKAAELRFSKERMIEGYFELYRKIAANQRMEQLCA
jgi:glycosyltransferase involved in cell wall biosynthesis